MREKPIIAVCGGHKCTKEVEQIAYEIGRNIAKVGAMLICGGLGGVMKAVCKGCKEAGGVTIGILPGEDKNSANPYVDIAIPTGLGYTRNTLVVGSADAVIALPGEYGTLSEIAFALIEKKPVIGLGSWDIPGMIQAKTPEEVTKRLKELIG